MGADVRRTCCFNAADDLTVLIVSFREGRRVSPSPSAEIFGDEFLKSPLATRWAQTRPLWLEPNWWCTEGVCGGGSAQKPPSGAGAWWCSPWPIVSLDYWIISGAITSPQTTCLHCIRRICWTVTRYLQEHLRNVQQSLRATAALINSNDNKTFWSGC